MSTFNIIRNGFYVLFGIAGVIAGFALGGEPWLILIGIGLIAWSGYDIHRELRDKSKSSDVAKMSKEREEIKNKLQGKGN